MSRWTLPELREEGRDTEDPGDNRIVESINRYIDPTDTWNRLSPFWSVGVTQFSKWGRRDRCCVCNRMIGKHELNIYAYQHRQWKVGPAKHIHGVNCFAAWVRQTMAPELQAYIDKMLGLVEDIQMQLGGAQ